MTSWNGTLPTILGGDIPTGDDWDQILDALGALTSAWDVYSGIAWTSSGTPPALGNGALEGYYVQVRKLVLYTGRLNMGSTTTYGTGVYDISLPVQAESGNRYPGVGFALDSSTATNNQPLATRMDGTSLLRMYGTGGQLAATVPFTFASGDTVSWSVLYAAA